LLPLRALSLTVFDQRQMLCAVWCIKKPAWPWWARMRAQIQILSGYTKNTTLCLNTKATLAHIVNPITDSTVSAASCDSLTHQYWSISTSHSYTTSPPTGNTALLLLILSRHRSGIDSYACESCEVQCLPTSPCPCWQCSNVHVHTQIHAPTSTNMHKRGTERRISGGGEIEWVYGMLSEWTTNHKMGLWDVDWVNNKS
jgi:hypothetical protein